MLCLKDYEDFAAKTLDRQTWAFFSQGAEQDLTLHENLRCFNRYALVPRMLRNPPARDLSVRVLGDRISMPVGIAPTAFQRLAHPDGEIAAAAAASEMGTVYTLSTLSSTPLEDVSRCRSGAGSSRSPQWLQLYVLRDRTGTAELVRRAEEAGFGALVLTVDTPVKGLQLKAMRAGLRLPPHISASNVSKDIEKVAAGKGHYSSFKEQNFVKKTLSWEDVVWLKSVTKLKIVLKGIITAEDALLAVKHGAAAVWVSNHGGRQLDGVISALDALPEISSALAGSGCEVYCDGGVRWGTDVLKALALGARAVFIGRPALWGLAHSGQSGVRSVLEILKSELDRAMHLSGCKDIADIGPHLVKRHHFSKF